MTYVTVDIENKRGGNVNLTRFTYPGGIEKGKIGIAPDQVVADGNDMFDEQDFVNALWDLYPDGLPPRVEKVEISEEEAEIQRLSLIFLNGFLVDAGAEPFEGTYTEATGLWHFTLVESRKAAEAYLAIKNDED